MFKKIVFITLLFVPTFLYPMESSSEPVKTIADQNEQVIEFPQEIWQLLANYLPGDNKLLNRLSRSMNFDDATYAKIMAALLYAIEEMPLIDEVDATINQYFKVTKVAAILPKVRNALIKIMQNHELSDFKPTDADIQKMHEGTSTLINLALFGQIAWPNRNGLTHSLANFIKREERVKANATTLLPCLTLTHINDLVSNDCALFSSMSDEHLATYEPVVKMANRNIKYFMKLIKEAPFNMHRTQLTHSYKCIRNFFESFYLQALDEKMSIALLIPLLLPLFVKKLPVKPLAAILFLLSPIYTMALCLVDEFSLTSRSIFSLLSMSGLLAPTLLKFYKKVPEVKNDSYNDLTLKYQAILDSLAVINKHLKKEMVRRNVGANGYMKNFY